MRAGESSSITRVWSSSSDRSNRREFRHVSDSWRRPSPAPAAATHETARFRLARHALTTSRSPRAHPSSRTRMHSARVASPSRAPFARPPSARENVERYRRDAGRALDAREEGRRATVREVCFRGFPRRAPRDRDARRRAPVATHSARRARRVERARARAPPPAPTPRAPRRRSRRDGVAASPRARRRERRRSRRIATR